MADDKTPGLTLANDHWHDVLDIRYRQFLEDLTALELNSAERHFEVFRRLLTRHIEFENEHLTMFDPTRHQAQKLIDADHLILTRTMTRVCAALEQIKIADNPRSELINQLNQFVRLFNILEHHDEREKTTLYPQIEDAISDSQSDSLGHKMNAAMSTATVPDLH